MKRNFKGLTIIIILTFSAAIVFFVAKKISTPRPVISGEDTQILLIDYFDEESNHRVLMRKYCEDSIRKILKDCSEKWTMSKSYGIRYGTDDVILYIAVADSNELKSICFERNAGYSTAGRGYNKYQIIDSGRALDALLSELGIDRTN